MANSDHVQLIINGVPKLVELRLKEPNFKLDLSGADLRYFNLQHAPLAGANLSNANLSAAMLCQADLDNANLDGANLSNALLLRASMIEASLKSANLDGAKLLKASPQRADFSGASLKATDFANADLAYVNFSRAKCGGAMFIGCNFKGAKFEKTELAGSTMLGCTFAHSDLAQADGLEGIKFWGPSDIHESVFRLSSSALPHEFLRGCGLLDWQIAASRIGDPNLSPSEITDALYEIQSKRCGEGFMVSPVFISYTHGDSGFVDALEPLLRKDGIRFWRDVHDLKAGRIDHQIDEAMRLHPIVISVLSVRSVVRDWVEHEAAKARELEQELGRPVLCPIALDDAWLTCEWSASLRTQIKKYFVVPFHEWEDHEKLKVAFKRLVEGLVRNYGAKKQDSPHRQSNE